MSLFAPSARAPGLNRILNFCLPVLPPTSSAPPRVPSKSGNHGFLSQSQSQLSQPSAGASGSAKPTKSHVTKRSTAIALLGKKTAPGTSSSSSRPLQPPAKTPFNTNPRSATQPGGLQHLISLLYYCNVVLTLEPSTQQGYHTRILVFVPHSSF